jgi:hypothetical protein
MRLQPDDRALLDTQLLGRGRADDGDVIPDQLRQEVGRLLQPAVVGEPAVIGLTAGTKDQFELGVVRRRGFDTRGNVLLGTQLRADVRESAPREKPVMQ